MKVVRRVWDKQWEVMTGGGIIEDLFISVSNQKMNVSWMEPKSSSVFSSLKFDIEDKDTLDLGIMSTSKFSNVMSIFPQDETVSMEVSSGFIDIKATKLPQGIKIRSCDKRAIKSFYDAKTYEVYDEKVVMQGKDMSIEIKGGMSIDSSILVSFSRNADKIEGKAVTFKVENGILHMETNNKEGEEFFDSTKVTKGDGLSGKYSASILKSILQSVGGSVTLFFEIDKPLVIYRKDEHDELFWMIGPYRG